ncbi:hypothetical protein ACFV2V_29825 [Streptomyces sp. NPDC059698]|uniref:hypothetical protein n=1 Tax=unclassified Streptomyces TaxID=2593676 RepID=UPI00093A8052|nr:hypothetical protein [Streptomyces sp. CB02366]
MNTTRTPGTPTPAPAPPVLPDRLPLDPADARDLLSDELYMARVWSLIRREEETRATLQPPAPPAPAQSSAPMPAAFTQPPAPTRVPGWVWQYSALTLSTGGLIALTGIGIGAAAPGLAQLDDILAAAGQALMSFAALAFLAALVLAARPTGRRTTGSGTTVNIRKAVIKRNRIYG